MNTNYAYDLKMDMTARNALMKRFSPFSAVGEDLKEVTSYHEALKVTGLDMKVNKVPMYLGDENNTLVDNHFCMMRDDGIQLGVVGKDYTPMQVQDAFEICDAMYNKGDAKFFTGGYMSKPKKQLNYAKAFMVMQREPQNIAGDDYDSFCIMNTSHDGSQGIMMRFMLLRLWCLNGAVREIPGKKGISFFKITHCKTAKERLDIETKAMLKFDEYVNALQRESEVLMKEGMTRDEFMKVVIPQVLNEMKIDINEDERQRGRGNVERVIANVVSAWDAADIQKYDNSMYRAVMALQDFETHYEPMRDTENNSIFLDRMIKGMSITNTVINNLVKIKGIKY